MITRQAEQKDFKGLIVLCKQFRQQEKTLLPDTFDRDDLTTWAETMRTQIKKGQMFLLEENKTIEGFIGYIDSSDCSWINADAAYISDMYVTPEYRTKGGAQALFQQFMRSIRQKGFSQVWANTGVENNRIQALLACLGFKTMDNPGVERLEEQVYVKKGLR